MQFAYNRFAVSLWGHIRPHLTDFKTWVGSMQIVHGLKHAFSFADTAVTRKFFVSIGVRRTLVCLYTHGCWQPPTLSLASAALRLQLAHARSVTLPPTCDQVLMGDLLLLVTNLLSAG